MISVSYVAMHTVVLLVLSALALVVVFHLHVLTIEVRDLRNLIETDLDDDDGWPDSAGL